MMPPHERPQQGSALRRISSFWGERRWLHFLLLAGLMTAFSCLLHTRNFRWSDFIDRLVYDQAFHIRGAQEPADVAGKLPHTKGILVVELKHAIPRPILARLLRNMKQAKVVAIDLMFVDHEAELSAFEKSLPIYQESRAEWKKEVQELARTFREVNNVAIGLWPAQETIVDPATGISTERRVWEKPPRELWQSARYRAHLWVEPDTQDGLVRAVRLFQDEQEKVPSLGLVMAAAALGISPQSLGKLSVANGYLQLGSRRVPVGEDGLMLIDYVGGRESFEYDTNRVVYELALEMLEPADFKDKLVIIGETDYKAKDMFTTPYGDMPGLQVHANIAATLLSPKGPPSVLPVWQITALALFCSVLLLVPLWRASLAGSYLVWLLLSVLMVLGAALALEKWHRVLPVSIPLYAMALTCNGAAVLESARLRARLADFVGRDMLRSVLDFFSSPHLSVKLGEATAFFCDLRGYSTLAERLDQELLSTLTIEYTDLIASVVRKHGGRPIDFLGDGVFCLFEGSKKNPDFALRAVQAAPDAQEAFQGFREKWRQAGVELEEMGVAIHTGSMMIGFIGSKGLIKPGAIGDAVNVASRVQSLSRECGYDVLITEATYEKVQDRVEAVHCGSFLVKGRTQPVAVYGLGERREGQEDKDSNSQANLHIREKQPQLEVV